MASRRRPQLLHGRSFFRHVRINSGASERALNEEAVSGKFLASATLSIPLAQAERVRDAVLGLENHTVTEIAELLRTSPK